MKIRISRIFLQFVGNEKTGGLVLLFATIASIVIANSPLGTHYANLWHYNLDLSLPGIALSLSVADWVNDGLMTVFFLLVGLEIRRELYKGELSEAKNASFPWSLLLEEW